MEVIKSLLLSLNEHLEAAQKLDEKSFEILYDSLEKGKRIFILAAGRSLLQMEGFAMRLMHLDYKALVVGGITTPAIGKEDLLIVASGSGETAGILSKLKKAKSIGANVVVITQNGNSSMGKEADYCIVFPKLDSVQPGGTQFEQFLGICLDNFILAVMKKKGLPYNYVYKNHANLE